MAGIEYGVILNQMGREAVTYIPRIQPTEYFPNFIYKIPLSLEFELGLPELLGGSIALRIDNRCGRVREIVRLWQLSRFGEEEEVKQRTAGEKERRRIICGQKGPIALYRVP